jgi:hypothetical protein
MEQNDGHDGQRAQAVDIWSVSVGHRLTLLARVFRDHHDSAENAISDVPIPCSGWSWSWCDPIFACALVAQRCFPIKVLVNVPAVQGTCGIAAGLVPSYTLGCGTFGGNSTPTTCPIATSKHQAHEQFVIASVEPTPSGLPPMFIKGGSHETRNHTGTIVLASVLDVHAGQMVYKRYDTIRMNGHKRPDAVGNANLAKCNAQFGEQTDGLSPEFKACMESQGCRHGCTVFRPRAVR